MKKFLTFILLICFIFSLTACNTPVHVQEPQAPAEEPQSSAPQTEETQPTEWEIFAKRMAEHNITESNLHTIENTGFSKEAIVEMTPAEINELLAMIRAHADQQKIDSALEILSNIEEAKQNEELVFCDGETSVRLELIEEWLKAKKDFDTATVWGVYCDEEEKFVFALTCTDGMPSELFTYWMEEDIVTGRLNALKTTLETDYYYRFIGDAGNELYLPKPYSVPTTWGPFVQAMAAEGITESNLHSLEQHSYTREDIMKMSADEIKQKLQQFRDYSLHAWEGYAELYLEGPQFWKEATQDEQFIYCNGNATAGLEMLDRWYDIVEKQEIAAVWVLMEQPEGNTVYILNNSQTDFAVLAYWMEDGVFQKKMTDIAELTGTEENYQIIDKEGTVLTIPKTPMER